MVGGVLLSRFQIDKISANRSVVNSLAFGAHIPSSKPTMSVSKYWIESGLVRIFTWVAGLLSYASLTHIYRVKFSQQAFLKMTLKSLMVSLCRLIDRS